MKVDRDTITSVGLTVLYEPEDRSAAVADIVFVAGFGGHPVKTWLYSPTPPPPKTQQPSLLPRRARSFRSRDAKVLVKHPPPPLTSPSAIPSLKTAKSASFLRLAASQESVHSSATAPLLSDAARKEPLPEIYWPLDLLPHSLPSTRILTWGCSVIGSGGRLPRSQNDIFAHAEDLLQELTLLRSETDTATRPVIFVAHSLGGVIVKEVLRRSEADFETHLRDLLPSTAAVVFLACPHRASDLAKFSDAVKSAASVTLDVPPGDFVLQHLVGTGGIELDLGREAFVRMWNDYNFKVKSFRENLPVRDKVLQSAGDYEVRRAASVVGDSRERAETLDANHLDICKFRSSQDQHYRTVLAALSSYVFNETNKTRQLNQKEKDCLKALLPQYHVPREPQPTISYPGTCLWLYDIPEFQAWHHRQPGYKNKLLWIKGKPGSGKTILLKSLRNRVEKQWGGPAGAAIIWATAEGRDLDSVFYMRQSTCENLSGSKAKRYGANPAGVYRSLLAQLYPSDPKLRRAILSLCERTRATPENPLTDAQVVSFFLDDYIDQSIETPSKRTFIFVDVADDCSPTYLRDLASHLAQLARNSDFSVCLASNHYANLPLTSYQGDARELPAIEVSTREHNTDDILRYISLNLLAEWDSRNVTVHRIAEKANGVFLWAEIVVNILNAAIDEGAMQDLIDDTVAELPDDMDGLYEWILGTLSPEEKTDCLALMQWVLLASEPLRLNDLRVAARLARPWDHLSDPVDALHVRAPTSLRNVRGAAGATFESPYQFHRFMRSRSVGLLELRPEVGGDGAVVHEPLGLQRVHVIHDSVRAFFLSGKGYAVLAGEEAARRASFWDVSHFVLLRTCLDYLNLSDFSSLGSSTPHSPIHSPNSIPPTPALTTGTTPGPAEDTPSTTTTTHRRNNIAHQRALVVSSYPFLQYAVENLAYHLVAPLPFRYFFPQMALLRALAADNMRLWRRWTRVLGTPEPAGVLSASVSAAQLLTRVHPSRFGLERVLRRLYRLSILEGVGGGYAGGLGSPTGFGHGYRGGGGVGMGMGMGGIDTKVTSPLSPRSPITPLSAASEGTAIWSVRGLGSGFGSLRTPLTPVSPHVALGHAVLMHAPYGTGGGKKGPTMTLGMCGGEEMGTEGVFEDIEIF